MEHSPRFPTHDPELDPPLRGLAGDRTQPVAPEFQRLVANPFLALLCLILLSTLVRRVLESKDIRLLGLVVGGPLLLGLVVGGLVLAGCLLQYHCLDCGHTGRLFRWKSHACPTVLARQRAGRVRWLRGPNPAFQTVLWVYLLAAVAILLSIVSLAPG